MHIPWQRLREDLPTLGFLVAMLVLTSASIIVAAWTENLRGITTLALLGLLMGYLLAHSTFSEPTALAFATVYGAFAIGLQQTLTLPNNLPLRQRSLEILQRLAAC